MYELTPGMISQFTFAEVAVIEFTNAPVGASVQGGGQSVVTVVNGLHADAPELHCACT